MLKNLSRKERNSVIKSFSESEETKLYNMFLDYYNSKHFASTATKYTDYHAGGYKLSTRSGSPLTDSTTDDDRMLVVSNWCEPIVTSIADFTAGTDGEVTFDDIVSQKFWDDQHARILIQEASVKLGMYGKAFLRYQDNGQKKVKVIEPQKIYEVINSITGERESVIHYYVVSREDAEELYPDFSFSSGDIYYAEEFSDKFLDKYIDGELVNEDKNLNPYKQIPFYKIQTNSEEKSDLLDVVPLNDELNVTLTNINEVLKYHAFPIYSPKGSGLKDNIIPDEQFKDIKISPKKLMNFPIERIASGGIDSSVIDYMEKLKQDMSVVSQVPIKLLMGEVEGNTSGVALERMMSGIIKQAEKRRTYLVKAMKEVNKIAVNDKDVQITLPNMLKTDESVKLDEAIKKESLGISKETIFTELGYEYKEEEKLRDEEIDKALTRIDEERNTIEQDSGIKANEKQVIGANKSTK